ncbi:ThiF family adenylyltransferase [Bradyrhizobium brasilense]|uniref:ThiF family adenylyltransferase n=1 Tax=Bradyrhizobium brasilense TaxID=1419277 RepID=UPI0030B87610
MEAGWWHQGLRPPRLSKADLARYREHAPEIGWRFEYPFSDRARRLDVFVTAGFPFVPARVALVDRPPFLTWPHVEKDGVLCLVPHHATFSVDDPYAGVSVLLDMAGSLIERFVGGDYDDDFRAEFLTYWDHAKKGSDRTVLSLIDPVPASRIIKVWEGHNRIILADTDEQLHSWLKNLNPALSSSEMRLRSGVLAWLETVPTPPDYPKTAADVYAAVAGAGAADMLETLAREIPPRLFVALGASTEHGPAIATTIISRPSIVRGNDPLTRGFRPSRVPEQVFQARLFGRSPASRCSVDRVDPSWIHGRAQDPRIATLRQSTVALLGCGSVGAPVALNLAHAGVAKLILVDQQSFTGANVGRHPLGVRSIASPKASELAKRIRADLPHVEVESYVLKAQDLLLRPDGPLQHVDLVVSALGDWPAESLLDEWHVANGRPFPIVYGWTEPHAAAGHAVIVSSSGGRLRDGLNEVGQPHLVATRWEEETRRYEPACGAAFEPYGPVELGFITSLVAQATLDGLLGAVGPNTHRIWLSRRAFLEAVGGAWSDAIGEIAPQALEGGTMIERPWGCQPGAKVLAA